MSAAVSSATREAAIARAVAQADGGALQRELAGLVAYRSESQNPAQRPTLYAYLREAVAPRLERLGFACRIAENPAADGPPFLLAHRVEDPALPTVLLYAHGDVVRGYDEQWRTGQGPWRLTAEGDRWYGRGTADNKGQYCINVNALEQVLAERGGRLGFNARMLVECGEEVGSPGLHDAYRLWKQELAADVFIASDGPRLAAERPTLFLGSRGTLLFDLTVDLREHAHHSGNWGGVLPNPGLLLAHALAALVDARGRLLVEGLRPPPVPPAVREALSTIEVGRDEDAPELDPGWGEPGLTVAERLFAWNTLEVLAYKTGNPDNPVGAIPPRACATCNLRFVVGTDWRGAAGILRRHLDAHGLQCVQVSVRRGTPATRLDPDDPWARWALESLARTTGKAPALLPNLGGTVPNDAFSEVLGLPTVWVPHSYPACCQHGPDEHLLASVAREGLAVMAGLFWDLGEQGPALAAR
ncbi:M20 family metallopeptidase, partial [Achromobacter sp. DMS1]|uniref:M20 family metallopeptidase n=1 Tax=Achromobacter sp. DMS1 TaxID=1688405 RepID=UPI001F180DF5